MNETKKILIGYDGSECADAALDDLLRAGLPPDAEAQILSVAEVWLPPPPPAPLKEEEQEPEVEVPAEWKYVHAKKSQAAKDAHDMAQRASARLSANFPDWKVFGESSWGSPSWELVFRADQWKPDLIVVGSHGRTALGRLILGSVSQRVLTETHCSVRVARGGVKEPGTPLRIIVAVDGSPGSEAAVREVATRIWPPHCEVQLIVVADPLVAPLVGELIAPLAESLKEGYEQDRSWAKDILANCAELLRSAEVKVTTVRREGDPKHELVKAAEEWGADCIFVGSTGFSNRLERFVLGSVSAAVAARAQCSVEVIRMSAG